MTQTEIGNYVAVRQKRIRVQKAKRGGLHRAAKIERGTFEQIGKIRYDHFAYVSARRAVKDQSKGPFSIVLANQYNGALEKRAAQLTAIEQQLAFQEFFSLRHKRPGVSHKLCKQSGLNLSYVNRAVFGLTSSADYDRKKQRAQGRQFCSPQWEGSDAQVLETAQNPSLVKLPFHRNRSAASQAG